MRKIPIGLYFIILISTLFIMSGCASVKHLPAQYFEEEHDLSVDVVKIPEQARMRDSGQGGIIGLLVKAGRASKMKKIFDGIEGETVKELVRQQTAGKLENYFYVDEDSQDLLLEINITQWGWFLPTTVLGIKTGSYQLEIMGEVLIYNINPKKKKIAYTNILSQKPLGNDPSATETQTALMLVVDDFSEQVTAFVFHEKP